MRTFVLGAALSLSLLAAEPARPLAKSVDELFSGAVGPNTPGAAILVARDGKILLTRRYGLANVEDRVPIETGTRFRIGSVTKQFTAAAILKLQEQGKLSVSDKLSRYIPDWPRGGDITVYHLLTHSSGIHNFTAKPDFSANVTQPVKLNDLILSFKNDRLDFDPGKKFLYDNSGYVLLGFIVEKASGLSYGDYLRRTFFEPLGMKDTGVYRPGTLKTREALGYSFQNGKVSRALDWHMSNVPAAGDLYSTVGDLNRWNEALFGGTLLPAASVRKAFTVGLLDGDDPSHPEDTGYGFGWTIDRLRGLCEIGHGGELAGFGSYLLRLPDQKLTVVVLLNAVPQLPGLQQWQLARRIAELALGPELPSLQKPVIDTSLSSAALDAVVGRYDMGDGVMFAVTREGQRVFMEITGRPKTEIYPQSDRKFFVNAGEAEATFVKDGNGKVTKAILKQAGERIDAPRRN